MDHGDRTAELIARNRVLLAQATEMRTRTQDAVQRAEELVRRTLQAAIF